ncbi:hypothetical protein ABHI18_010353 [Aspergillus niger]
MIIAITSGKTEASEESPELVLGREVGEVQTGDDKTAIFNICFDFGEHFSGLLIGVGKAFIRYDYCAEGSLGNGSERGGRGLHAPEGEAAGKAGTGGRTDAGTTREAAAVNS